MFAKQTRDFSWIPSTDVKRQVWSCVCKPRSGRAETGGSLGSLAILPSPVGQFKASVSLFQK